MAPRGRKSLHSHSASGLLVHRAWLLVFLLLPSSAAAATIDAHLAVLGEADFHGTGAQAWTTAGSMLDYRDGLGSGAMTATGSISWHVVQYNLTTVRTPAGSAAGPHEFQNAGDAYRAMSGSAASLKVTPIGQHHSVRLIGTASATHDASFRILPSQDVSPRYLSAPDAYGNRAQKNDFPNSGGRAQTTSTSMDCTGCRIVGFDADVDVDGTIIHTGIASSTTTPDPLNQGTATVDVYRILEAQVDGNVGLDGIGWIHYITNLAGNLTGDIQLQDAAGSGTVNGTPIPSSQHLFQAIGNMTVKANWADRDSRWTLTGDPQFVAVDATTVAGVRPSHTIPLAEVAAGVGLLAVAIAFFTNVGRAITSSAAALMVRVDAKKTRAGQQILALLHDRPVATRKDLAETLGMTDFMARYWSDRLTAQDELQKTMVGGEVHFMLNHSSLRFPTQFKSNDWTKGTADVSLASINHPTRRMLFDAIQRLGNADYAALRADLGDKCPSQSAASKHLKAMLDAGAIAKFTQSGRAFFMAAMSPEALHAHQHVAH
jgi:hypothetical protein